VPGDARALPRDQPDPDKDRDGRAPTLRSRTPAAAHADERGTQEETAGRAQSVCALQEIIMIKLVISGIGGRMGQRILAVAQQDSAFKVVYGLESPSYQGGDVNGLRVGSDTASIKGADVVIDFTAAEATTKLASEVAKYKRAYVIGTTGLNESQKKAIAAL